MLIVLPILIALLLGPLPVAPFEVQNRVEVWGVSTGAPAIDIDTENGASDDVGGTLHTSITDGSGSSQIPGGNLGSSDEPNSVVRIPTSPMSGLGQTQTSSWCGWADVANPPPAGDVAWAGNDPAAGTLQYKSCPILLPGTPGAPGNLDGRPVEYQFAPNGAVPNPVPPNPETLARQAIAQLQVPVPTIGVGPDRSKLAVNLWTWLWVDNPGPLTSSVSLAGVTVTATATIGSVTWSLGEPPSTGGAYSPGPPSSITCEGSGSPPPVNYDWQSQPPCGHKYTWMSTADRTRGTRSWPVTATSNWNVTWQSNTGVSGSTVLNATSNDALEIGEYRTVLVDGPGG